MAFLRSAKRVPSNMVAYRASSLYTPTGWTEYTTARGRVICGMVSGGTDGGTVGTALTNSQDKSKSIAHTHEGAAHTHAGPSHHHQVAYEYTGGTLYHNDVYYGAGTDSSGGGVWERYNSDSTNQTGNIGHKKLSTSGTGATGARSSSTSGAMSTGGTVVTSDVLAYIQLMAIKKG